MNFFSGSNIVIGKEFYTWLRDKNTDAALRSKFKNMVTQLLDIVRRKAFNDTDDK